MPLTKITLSADRELVARAKKLAKAEGTSLSSLFTRYLDALIHSKRPQEKTGPLTRAATGLVKLPRGKNDRKLIEDALSEKYGL